MIYLTRTSAELTFISEHPTKLGCNAATWILAFWSSVLNVKLVQDQCNE